MSDSRPSRRRKRVRRAHGRIAPDEPSPRLRRIPVCDYATEADIEIIHEASVDVLGRLGIEFRDAVALDTWRRAGASIDGALVRIPEQLLMEQLAIAPETYVQHARNSQRSVTVGGDHMIFSPV